LILPFSSNGAPGLVIEMKSATGRLTPQQNEWLAHYTAQGWITHVCKSADEAREVLCSYLSTSPGACPALD
jgi:hypothetical protein